MDLVAEGARETAYQLRAIAIKMADQADTYRKLARAIIEPAFEDLAGHAPLSSQGLSRRRGLSTRG